MNEELRIAIPVPTSNDLEYNRRSWPSYASAVREAGGLPVKVELGMGMADLLRAARECDGVLLPGSPADVDPAQYGQKRISACAPADTGRDEVDRILLEEAFAAGKPVLGICYGAQSLNVWRGGTLVQDLASVPVNHGAGSSVAVAHTAIVVPGSVVAGLVAEEETTRSGGEMRLPVNSSHHQAIEIVGAGLKVVAVSSEDGVVEAVERMDGSDCPAFVVGVQWHPERTVAISAASRGIFGGFVAAVRAWEPPGVRVNR